MKEIKFGNKKRYVNLSEESRQLSDSRDFKVIPESRAVQLSGKKWKLVWNRPVGVILQRESEQKRIPIFDLTRFVQIILYGLSLIFLGLGFYNLLGKRKGEGYG
jgi:hypothetical protein